MGPPDASARRELEAAAAVLARMDRSRRQLADDQWRVVQTAREDLARQRAAGVRTIVFTFLVLLFLGIPGVVAPTASPWATPLSILVGVAVVAWLGRRLLGQLRDRLEVLEGSWAAHVPEGGGEARCHVCGAPVAGGGDPPVARCRYCGADNLVDPVVLARRERGANVIVRGLDAAIEEHATAVSMIDTTTATSFRALTVGMVVVAPIFTLLSTLVIAGVDTPFDATMGYGITGPGWVWNHAPCECVYEVRGHRTKEGLPSTEVDPRSLIGRKDCFYGGTVTGLAGNPLTGNHAVLSVGISERRRPMKELCLEPSRRGS